MGSAAKSNLKRVSFELGGKPAHIIFNDVDIDIEEALDKLAVGILANAVQVCSSASRVCQQDTILQYIKIGCQVAAGIQTQNISLGLSVAKRIQAGTEMGEEALDDYTQMKSVRIKL